MYTLAYYFNICLCVSTSETLELKCQRTALVSANIVMQEKKALKKMKRRLANGQDARETSKLVALSSIWLGLGKYIFTQNYIVQLCPMSS